jgi:hypothetical protein
MGTALLATALVFGAPACAGSTDRQLGTVTLAISSTTPPALSQGTAMIYQVSVPVPLPLAARPSPLPNKGAGYYPGDFWFQSNELQLQLDYVITNLESSPVTVELMCDAWNDFIRYTPQVTVTEEGVDADPSTEDRLIYIPALGRISGTISFDDFERVARVMGALSNPKPAPSMNPYHLLVRQTDITTDPLAAPFIPPVVAGLRGFDLSLRDMNGPDRVLVEATLTIRDHGNHLVPDGSKSPNGPPSKRYSPVAPSTATTGG